MDHLFVIIDDSVDSGIKIQQDRIYPIISHHSFKISPILNYHTCENYFIT